MTQDEKLPGYRGRLNEQCVTLGEVLGPAGYRTIQTGKWHVGGKKKEWWPSRRGFEKSFGSPLGGGFYFRSSAFNQYREVVRNETVLYTPKIDPPEGWYTTDAYTDEGLNFVREAAEEQKPFLWYLAYNAPHWPLRAKAEDIDKYRGKYQVGWDVIRQRCHQKLIEQGLIKDTWKLSPRDSKVPAWETLSDKQKEEQGLMMATYAAMVDCVDQNVGKIVKELKKLGVYENTLLMFLCDNGGSAEPSTTGINRGKGEVGTAESFAFYGASWANVSDTPFHKFKSHMHEGGIATPFVAHWPAGIQKDLHGQIIHEPAHVRDLMSTCIEVSGATYPKTYKDQSIVPLEGVSLNAAFQGQCLNRQAPLFFEFNKAKAIRQGSFKLVTPPGGKWELYNMESDRTELNNLASKHPEKVEEMAKSYEAWAKRCNVVKKKGKK
jgi:arylsulfatase A-like enzyme